MKRFAVGVGLNGCPHLVKVLLETKHGLLVGENDQVFPIGGSGRPREVH